jgi:integrase
LKFTAYFRQTFEPLLADPSAKRSGRRWSAGTKRLGLKRRYYRRAVKLFVSFAGNRETSAVTCDQWRAFQSWLTDVRGLSALQSPKLAYAVRRVLAHAAVPWAAVRSQTGSKKHAMPATFCEGSLLGAYKTLYEPVRLRGGSHLTKRLYWHTLTHFHRFLGREPLLSDLTCETANRLLASVRESGLAPRTVNAIRDRLLALWRFLHRTRVVDEWPVDVPEEVEPHRVPLAWSMEDVGKILTACRSMKGNCGDVPAAIWWESLHRVLLDTGERIRAVLGVTWDAVDLDAGSMLIAAELRKGKRRDRLYELHADTVAALRKMQGTGKVFPWHLNPSYLWPKYKRLLKSAGLTTGRTSAFHRMRKTTASHYQQAGGDASAFLDHSDPRITRRYLDPRIVKVKSAAALLPRPVMIGGDA